MPLKSPFIQYCLVTSLAHTVSVQRSQNGLKSEKKRPSPAAGLKSTVKDKQTRNCRRSNSPQRRLTQLNTGYVAVGGLVAIQQQSIDWSTENAGLDNAGANCSGGKRRTDIAATSNVLRYVSKVRRTALY